ncbi:MAG: hypothetical protein ABH873_04400 [Candidatus Firestonebacteria bacterium]
MFKKLLNEKYTIIFSIIIICLLSFLNASNIFKFNPDEVEKNISEKLQLKEELLLKKYNFSGVSSSIFSPLIIVESQPVKVVETPKKEPPPPVIDPYEIYYKDLKTYQIFGFSLDSNNNPSIFLSKGNDTLSLKKGDKFDAKYFIKDINDNEVIIGLLTDDKFQMILK